MTKRFNNPFSEPDGNSGFFYLFRAKNTLLSIDYTLYKCLQVKATSKNALSDIYLFNW